MKNIILPIDFSDTTDILVEGAVDFAKEIAGKIYLIHVAPADIGFAIGDMGFQYFRRLYNFLPRDYKAHPLSAF